MIARAKHSLAGTVDVVIIGAGHAGLAMSHCLSARAIEHVVLERGDVANSWRNERWDSLRLLTPNWMSRLPGYSYFGEEPDAFMDMNEVVDFVSGYGALTEAPIYTQTTVTGVEQQDDGYRIKTNRGEWRCRAVVIASGAFNAASVPAVAEDVPTIVRQVTSKEYKNPQQLEEGGVLVVGASATGLQIGDEIHQSGRPVTLAVGEHVRMPRTYRGHDIQWWMHTSGILDECVSDADDLNRLRNLPSPQLIGTPDHRTLDLNALIYNGVRIAGRVAGVRDGKALFSGSLRNVCALADLKMNRLLDSIDDWASANGFDDQPKQRFQPTNIRGSAPLSVDLNSGEIKTIVWATGYRPDYSWLDVPVLDRKGKLRHDKGVVDSPGMYAMGQPFMRRRKSSFIHGAEDDARDLSKHLATYLDQSSFAHSLRVAV